MTEFQTGRVWRLPLPYDRPPLSQNQRLHYMKVAAAKKQIKGDVMLLARAQKLPKNQLRRVLIQLHWIPSVKRPRDTDNPSPTLKAAIDGLVRYGLVPDDNSDVVESSCIIGALRPGRAQLSLIVTELIPTVVNTPE